MTGSDLQSRLINNAEHITTAKGMQNPFPRDLNEQILWNRIKTTPSAVYPLTGLNSDLNFPPSAGFQKMSVNHTFPDASNIEIHYQFNTLTNKAYDMKVATPPRSGASFKEK